LPGKPELLFQGPNLGGVKYWRAWDIAPEGERFVAVEQAPVPTELQVVLNWSEELKRLVPTYNWAELPACPPPTIVVTSSP